MVIRARLNSRSVDESIVPDRGEKWIADTKVRGFGLRLIMTSAGPRKLYCIRTTNQLGKSVRKSFDLDLAKHYRRPVLLLGPNFEDAPVQEAAEPTLGEFIEEAREWASNEIAKLKGSKTVETENAERNVRFRSKLADVTLEQGAEAVLANYRKMKMKDSYLIQLNKLFAIHVPRDLKTTKLMKFNDEQAERLLNLRNIMPGNRQTLVPFLAKIFITFQSLAHVRNVFGIAQDAHRRSVRSAFVDYEPYTGAKESKFRDLFAVLESEGNYWQQALCLRLYFDFHCPLSRLMAAQWSEIFIRNYTLNYHPEIRRQDIIWRYSTSRLGYEVITKRCAEIFQRLRKNSNDLFSGSPYWFPSANSRKVQHIRSIDHVWQNALFEVGLGYVSPRKLRLEYQSLIIQSDKGSSPYNPK